MPASPAVIAHRDAIGVGGQWAFHLVDFGPALARWGHLPKADLLTLIPCLDMEHRGGVCPLGFSHPVRDVYGKNTVVAVPKKSIVGQMVGAASPTSLAVTRICTGTSADPTAQSLEQLVVETYRTSPTDVFATGGDLQAQVFWYFGSSQANAGVDLQEHGVLIGGATDTPGTGKLFARFLQQFSKTIAVNASGSYLLTVS